MRFLFLAFLFAGYHYSFSQSNRKVAVWDMTTINSETNLSRLYAVTHLLNSAGIPFEITNQIDSAVLYPVIITASRIENNKLTITQENNLLNYVNNGGVLITSSMRDSSLFNLCGISGYISEDTMYSITWDINSIPSLFEQVNDSLEITVSLGDSSNGPTFFSRGYVLNTAVSLGEFENGYCALAKNNFGNGYVYSFGSDFRDIYLRNQLDFDLNAHRTYSNGFEPTADVFMFIVRNIVRNHIPNSVYSYPVPGKSKSVVMITHDIDSESALDTMLLFADFEMQRNITGQYNITTRYFNDGWMTSFYVGSVSEINDLKTFGHTLSSHSVGHFPDFADESIFPFGYLGNDPTNYQPFYTGGITQNGTVLGELEVSKELIEDDHGVKIRSFRAGHLAFPDSLVLGLEMMNYEFNSTQSANNILTAFPYYAFQTRSFGSFPSTVLEIPMTISDVFNSDPISVSNYMQKVTVWLNATRKYAENNAPVNILIHPNRTYKLIAQQAFLDSLSNEIAIVNMEEYGDFWRKRDSLLFHTVKSNDTLTVWMDNDKLHPNQSFVIDTQGINEVLFKDENGQILAFDNQFFSGTQQLYFPHVSSISVSETSMPRLHLFPNPAGSVLTLMYDEILTDAQAGIYDVQGRLVQRFNLKSNGITTVNLSDLQIQNGMYLLIIDHKTIHFSRSFIYSE